MGGGGGVGGVEGGGGGGGVSRPVDSCVLFKNKTFFPAHVCCFMLDYEKSRPTLRHFT